MRKRSKDSTFLRRIAVKVGFGNDRERLLALSKAAFVTEQHDAGLEFCDWCEKWVDGTTVAAWEDSNICGRCIAKHRFDAPAK